MSRSSSHPTRRAMVWASYVSWTAVGSWTHWKRRRGAVGRPFIIMIICPVTVIMAMRDNEIQVGAQGRVVIPAALRKALDLKPADRLIAWRVDEGLVLELREQVERRLKARFARIPSDVSLSDELLSERRADAALESDRKTNKP